MKTITVEHIQDDVKSFLSRIDSGEPLVILREGKPIAEMKPLSAALNVSERMRPFGLCAGEFIVPSDFDSELPEDVVGDFEGNETAA